MADQKLSELTELAATPTDDDEVYIRDVSEAAAAESKRITIANLLAGAGMGIPALTEALFRANAATGTANNPQNMNDNNTATDAAFTLNEYGEVAFGHPFYITEYRLYGDTYHTGDGKWKIQVYIAGDWLDNTVDIPIETANEWGDWTALTYPVIASRIRLVATTQDAAGANKCDEMEMRG